MRKYNKIILYAALQEKLNNWRRLISSQYFSHYIRRKVENFENIKLRFVIPVNNSLAQPSQFLILHKVHKYCIHAEKIKIKTKSQLKYRSKIIIVCWVLLDIMLTLYLHFNIMLTFTS